MSDFNPRSDAKLEQELEPFGLSIEAIGRLDPGIEWVALFRHGRLEEAYAQLRQGGPLPEMTSHIRADPDAQDNVPLRQLQYLIAWTARDRGLTGVSIPDDATGFRIAAVGGGPAGLAATVRLLEKGHAVDLFEREEKLGGAPALVYCEDRLPDPADEIDALLQPALQAGRLTITLGQEASVDALQKNHDAVLLATGCWNEPSLSTADGVWSALRFLKAVRNGQCTTVPSRIVLLCGGDAAMDAAVTAKQLGAEQLTLIFDCPRHDAQWHLPESWFDKPSVRAQFDTRATGYQVEKDGAVHGVILENDEVVETEMVIEAMGLFAGESGDRSGGIFCAGALVNGGASVQQCMREGFDAADEIDGYLQGSSHDSPAP